MDSSIIDAISEIINTPAAIQQNLTFMFSNLTLMSMMLLSLKDRPFPKTKQFFNKYYDYVIVGAGPGGSVLANRLTELPCVSVLLIEAGGNAPLLTEIPAYARIFYGSKIDWLYKTEPQKHAALSHTNQQVNWNSGKAIGGGSVLNAMLYVRGNKRNYDDWEKEGATGWSYKDVFPYFLKLEDNRDLEGRDEGFHQQGGPMTVENPRYEPEIKEPLIEAMEAIGYNLTDVNGRQQTGIYDIQATFRNQQRCSTAKAYLVPAEDRPNLTILKNAFAKKILFEGNKAVGIEFDFQGFSRTVYVKREVIISSGSVRAPQLLMLSGVGPKDHLQKFGIPVVVDSPAVGQNLQDHYGPVQIYKLSSAITPVILKYANPINILRYIIKREGPLTAASGANLLGFFDGLNATTNSPDFPLIESYFAEYAAPDALFNYNLDPKVYAEVLGKYTASPLYVCFSSLLQPYSRGEILLKSKNPYDRPIIDPRYYEDERDVQEAVKALKICNGLATSKQMEKVGSKPLDTVYPACKDKNGEEYLDCVARQLITTIYHPVGTCRMGSRNDPRSVVDPQLRVIGTEGLRVVCAAVMPIIPSGNTNIPTMMVSEKIADEMKKDIVCKK